MPTAVKLQSEYGNAIQVILVESQGASQEDSLAFALKNKWLGNQAIWTTERPFSTGGNGLPSYALLGPDGKVIFTGNSASDHSKIQKAIEEMVKKASSAPADAPDAVAKLYKELDRGNYAKAAVEARKLSDKAAGKDEATSTAVRKFEGLLTEKVRRDAARVRTLVERGEWIQAQAIQEALMKAVKGEDALAEPTVGLTALFEGPDAQKALADAKELDRLAQAVFVAGKDEKAVKKLRKFATDHTGTKVGERADMLAGLAEKALASGNA